MSISTASVACSIDGCSRTAKSRTWCGTHYERWRVHGDPMHQRETEPCLIDGCQEGRVSKGMCQGHYDRARRLGDPLAEGRYRGCYGAGQPCAADGCAALRTKRDWCDTHYRRWQRTGSPNAVRFPKADRIADCLACGKPTAHGLRQFCSSACQAFALRAGARTCRLCTVELPVALTAGGMRKRGNGRGLCLTCAETAPCAGCGGPRVRGGANKLVCRPCRRPASVADSQIRRARKVDAICEHGDRCVTVKVVKAIRAGECFYCAAPAEHADHFTPLARGGKHCVDNLVPACADCNLSKSASEPWQWWTDRAEVKSA